MTDKDIEDVFGEPIYTYTSEQAIEDGILFQISHVTLFKNSIVNIVTTNLMSKGYWEIIEKDVKLNLPNIQDLLNQIIHHILETGEDTFYSLDIELPSGKITKIYVAQNETGLFTAMLPEDY